jgi:chaperonin cofactor prefoldin
LKEIQTVKGLELQNAINKLDQLQQEHSNVNFECKRLQNELADEKVGKATTESQLANC